MFSKRNVRHLGVDRQLFLDDDIIDKLSGMKRRIGIVDKHPGNPVLKAEHPWERDYPYIWGTVLRDDAHGYRIWYQSWSDGLMSGVKPGAVFSYASSEDGVHWRRPHLGLVEYQGSKENNIILAGHELPSIVHRPAGSDPSLRYRMLCLSPDRTNWAIFHSPDGIHWSKSSHPGPYRDFGILARDFAYLFFDERNDQWVSCCKLCRRVGHWPDWSIRRCLAITTCADDGKWEWEVPELVLAPDARDDAEAVWRTAGVADRLTTNYPDEYWCDFQVMAVWPYEGLYIGLIAVFDASGMGPAGNQDGTVRIQLAVSRDLRRWNRVADRQTFIDLGPEGSFDASMLLGMSSSPVILNDEIRIYYSGMALSHMHGAYWDLTQMPELPGGIGLATIRRDGFVALEVGQIGRGRVTLDATGRTSAGAGEGYFRTKHFTFTGSRLYLNVDSAAHGRANGVTRVEFIEPDDTPIPGYRREECDPIKVDSVRHIVSWNGNPDILSLQSRIVRLKFYCRTTRLYSFWFEP